MQEELKTVKDIFKDYKEIIEEAETVHVLSQKINDLDMLVNREKALYNKYIVVRRGKKKYYLVVFN